MADAESIPGGTSRCTSNIRGPTSIPVVNVVQDGNFTQLASESSSVQLPGNDEIALPINELHSKTPQVIHIAPLMM